MRATEETQDALLGGGEGPDALRRSHGLEPLGHVLDAVVEDAASVGGDDVAVPVHLGP